MCSTLFEFKIPTKYLFTLVHIICNPTIQVSTNMSIVVKPLNFMPTTLNDFTVFSLLQSPGCKKIPVRVDCEDDALTAAQNFDSDRYLYNAIQNVSCYF